VAEEVSSSVSLFAGSGWSASDSLWKSMRDRRMAWEGSLNVLAFSDDDSLLHYLAKIRERFFTGEGEFVAKGRRMDLIFHNIYHLLVVRPEVDFGAFAHSILTPQLEECVNMAAVTFVESPFEAQVPFKPLRKHARLF